VSILTRFKSDEKLQAEALDILEEMIRRDLLTVSVSITGSPIFLSCAVREAIVENKAGAGIELLLDREFKLPADDEPSNFETRYMPRSKVNAHVA
jgi:hypothetical protein